MMMKTQSSFPNTAVDTNMHYHLILSTNHTSLICFLATGSGLLSMYYLTEITQSFCILELGSLRAAQFSHTLPLLHRDEPAKRPASRYEPEEEEEEQQEQEGE